MTVPLNEFSMLIDQFILDVNDFFFRKLTFWNSCYPAQKMKFKKKTLIWSHLLKKSSLKTSFFGQCYKSFYSEGAVEYVFCHLVHSHRGTFLNFGDIFHGTFWRNSYQLIVNYFC